VSDLLFCLRFLAVTAWRDDRRRLLVGAGALLLGALATPVVALAVRELTDAVVARDAAAAVVAALVTAVALVAQLMMGHVAHPYYFEASEVVETGLQRRLVRLVGSGALERLDDPAFADGVDLLREDIGRTRMTVQAAMQLLTVAAALVLTAVVLATVAPALLLLLLPAAVPVLAGRRAEAALDAARRATAGARRRARHLRSLAASPHTQKEIRLSEARTVLVASEREQQDALTAGMRRGYRRHALRRSAGQLAFALAYVGAVLLVYARVRAGQAGVGDIVLVIVLATQVGGQVTTGLSLLTTVYSAAAGLRRFAAMEAANTSAPHSAPATGAELPDRLPDRLADGIALDGVTFTYPGTGRAVLHDVSLRLPAGAVVALVGENGAGKSTLVKLLAGLYTPSAGRVLVDGVDLAAVHPARWRERTALLFQDFARFELELRESVGLGRLADLGDDDAVRAAVHRARADALLERLGPGDLLGRGYGDGTELSGGQWQAVGFSRTMMRAAPLLLCLDEPGHALDPFAEQRVVDAYQEVAREVAERVGGVTLFVTHRLSTVRLADLVVVLHDGRVAELGPHDELRRAGGRYADLWAMQADAYQR
jgi:ATP-binding cassette, subfamily B, bacterial